MSKPRMVMIGGWGQTAEALNSLALLLSECAEVKTTSAYDLASNWQASGRELTYSFPPDDLSVYTRQLRDEFLIDGPKILLGWSMGGMIAMEAAHRFSRSVERLVLVGACASFCDREEDNYITSTSLGDVEQMAAGLMEAPQRTIELFLLKVYRRSQAKQVLAEKAQQALQLGIDILGHGLAYLKEADLRATLNDLDQATLLLHGERDRVVPLSAATYLEQHLGSVKSVTYADGTHGLCEQLPTELGQQIKDFLSNGE